jgi:hypothetical protein
LIQHSESFSADPGWIGVNNFTGPQSFGWSNTDNTGTTVNPPGGIASGAGEMGGSIARDSVQAYYAFNTGTITANDALGATGVYRFVGGSGGINFGWFRAATSTGDGGDTRNFIGFLLDDGVNLYVATSDNFSRNRDDARAAVPTLQAGVTYPFSMTYDPNGNGGNGSFTVAFGSNSYTRNMSPGEKANMLSLDRFGLFPVSVPGSTVTAFFDDLSFTINSVVPGVVSTWNVDSSGDWTSAANWTNGAPNGVGYEAQFLGAITSPRTVVADAAIKVAKITFNNANRYTITGAGSLTLQTNTGTAAISVLAGSHDLDIPLTFASNTDITVAGGATLTLGDPTTIDPGVTVNKTGALLNPSLLSLGSNARLVLNSGPTLLFRNPALGSGAKIDARASSIVINSGTLSGITSQIKSALENGGAFDWQGPGIGSSEAFSRNTTAGSFLYALGVILNDLAQVGGSGPIYTTFGGQTTFGGEVLVKFTWFGDADLSGSIDATDYSLIDNGYVNGLSGWINGDFDYSGVIDATDYALIDNAYVNQAGPLADALIAEHTRMFGGEYAAALNAIRAGMIPEPNTLGISSAMLLAAGGSARWRRRSGRTGS